MAQSQDSPGLGPDGQVPRNGRLRVDARVLVQCSGQARTQRTGPGRGPPQDEEQEASPSLEPDARRDSWRGSDATKLEAGPGQGGGPADV